MLTSCMKPFVNEYYSTTKTWKFSHKECASEEILGQNDLIDQMQNHELMPGEGDAYIAEKLRLRDKLHAIIYPVTMACFDDYMV